MDAKELKRIAVKEGVPQAVVEKDYALSIALAEMSEAKSALQLVFKGGTAIRKVYFANARFSEDLDFTVLGLGKKECLELLKAALQNKTLHNIAFGQVEEEQTSAGLKAAVKFTGPLGYPQRIRFDFSFRDNLAEKPVEKKLIDTYRLGEHEIISLTLEELFAEKLHALGTREAPRDLYDVWYLLEKGTNVDYKVLDKKFAYYNERFDPTTALQNAKNSEKEWKKDLRHLVNQLPDFDTLFNEVEKKLTQTKR